MSAFIASFFFVLLAEMGDKTQLLALAFATKFKPHQVLIGIFCATILCHGLAVGVGRLLTVIVPLPVISLVAALSFVGFGLWTLRGDRLDDGAKQPPRYGPIFTVAVAFFLAEMGDKTQLATISLAVEYRNTLGVLAGTTLAMVAADAVAIIVGIVMHKHVPEKAIKYTSVIVFIGFGLVGIYQVLAPRFGPPVAGGAVLAALAVATLIAVRLTRGAVLLSVLLLFLLPAGIGSAGGFLPLAGEPVTYTIQLGDSLFRIARRHDISYSAIVRANRIVNANKILADRALVIPRETIVPKVLRQGIIINLPETRLYLFAGGKLAAIYPVAIGLPTWPTPTGVFTVLNKVKDPAWYMPPEMAEREDVKREMIPAGPDNPLGDRWVGTSIEHTGIHGTNRPMSIGRALSHGCIRLYPEDIGKLFEAVSVRDPGEIIYEPVKATADGPDILVEAHPDIYGLVPDLERLAREKIAQVGAAGTIDPEKLRRVLRESAGVPVRVNRDEPER